MGFFGRLFGSEATAEKAIDAISYNIDKFSYTDQEKSEAREKSMLAANEFVLDLVRSGLPFNGSRRLFAKVIVFLWVALKLSTAAYIMAAPFITGEPPTYDQAKEVIEMLRQEYESMVFELVAVLSFYFGSEILEKATGGRIEIKGRKKGD